MSEGVKNISNQLTIGTEICAEHPELRAVAQAQGWWSGEEDFSFSAVFSPDNPPARMEMAKQRYMGGTALLQQHSGTFALLCHHVSELVFTTENLSVILRFLKLHLTVTKTLQMHESYSYSCGYPELCYFEECIY